MCYGGDTITMIYVTTYRQLAPNTATSNQPSHLEDLNTRSLLNIFFFSFELGNCFCSSKIRIDISLIFNGVENKAFIEFVHFV